MLDLPRFLQPADRILAEYIEVESGRNHNRPEMARAIAEAKLADATLLVAEISRLAHSVYFTSRLMEERVRFKACDIPNADEFGVLVTMGRRITISPKALSIRAL